jgi:hypothetical protein
MGRGRPHQRHSEMQSPVPQHVSRGPAVVGASLLRLSIAQRLVIAVALAAVLWAAAAWALFGGTA